MIIIVFGAASVIRVITCGGGYSGARYRAGNCESNSNKPQDRTVLIIQPETFNPG